MSKESESYKLQSDIPPEVWREIKLETEREILRARFKDAQSNFYGSIRHSVLVRGVMIGLCWWLWPSYINFVILISLVDIIEWMWKGGKLLQAGKQLRNWDGARHKAGEVSPLQSERQMPGETRL